jgi:hypothetical protein
MRRPAILALALLAIAVVLAGRWLSPSSPIAANGIAAAPEAPEEADVDNLEMAVELAPVDPERSPAPVVALETIVASSELEPAPEVGTIQGRAVSSSGEPLEGARVEAVIQSDDNLDAPAPEAVSDIQGRFTLEGCKHQGVYELKTTLDGWWQVVQVIRPTGATDVELVLQRGAGVRGQVIEALDSHVEDYIVVVRTEYPAVEWTPDRHARLKRSIQREMRKMIQNPDEFRTQMLMQELGHQPEQRPDGEAWTLLDQDGRFELSNVRPGKSSVIVAARNRTRGLATITGVDVQSGIVTEDARLDPVNMNEHACVYRVAIVNGQGAGLPSGRLDVLPVEKDGHGKFTVEFKDGEVRFLGPLWIDQITVEAEGYQPLLLRSPLQSIRVTLEAD